MTPEVIEMPAGQLSPPLRKGGEGGSGDDVLRLSVRGRSVQCSIHQLVTNFAASDRLASIAPSPRHATPPGPPFLRGGENATLRVGLALALCLFALCGSPLLAAPENDVDPTAEKESTSNPDPKPTAPDADEPIKPADVLKALREADHEIDRLESAIEGMRSAQKRISAADTSRDTQKIQDQVVKDLEDVLAMLKKQQSRRRGQSQNQKRDQDQQQSDRQKMQKDQTDPQNSGTKKSQEKNGDPRDGRRNDGKSADSQERTDAARVIEEKARRAQMIKDVWGHLPPHVREAMLNSVSEKYLPKYEELVKKYYEALAEQNRKKTGK